MILAWGLFIIGIFGTLIWSTEIIPSLSTNNRYAGVNLGFYLIMALSSAQYIWG